MKMTATFSLLALTAGLFLHSTEIQVPRAVQKPVLDGKISPGEWPGPLTEDFYLFAKANAEKSPQKVQLRMQYDPENIYICLYCNDPRIPDSSGDTVFNTRRYEIRFGEKDEVKVFAVPLDGKKIFPAGIWKVAASPDKKVLEICIPLKHIPGYRIYKGNIVREGTEYVSSLFPIGGRSYVDPVFHRTFRLGTDAQIRKDLEQSRNVHAKIRKNAAGFAAQFKNVKAPAITGAKARSFRISPLWKPYTFYTGKDFHFMFLPRAKKFMPGKQCGYPLFQDAIYQVHAWYLNSGMRNKKTPITKLLNDPETNAAGYILRKTANPIFYCTDGLYNTFEHELKESKESREKFVKLYGKRLLAVDVNEAVGPGGGFPMIMRKAKLNPRNKKEAYEALKKVSFDPARTYIRDWAVFYPELAPWRTPISATGTDHIFCSYGFGMAGQELGPKTLDMAFSYCISRGAARQYGKPMRHYLTTHDDKIIFPGTEQFYTKYTFNDYRFARRPGTRLVRMGMRKGRGRTVSVSGPQYGVPKEDWRRCFIYSYMAGSNVFFDESGHYLMYSLYDHKTIDREDPLAVNLRERKWHLSDMGQMMSDFYDKIVCKEDRGVVYTPIALVWDLYHGYFPNYMMDPWGLFPSTEGDNMIRAVQSALYPWDKRIYYARGFRTGNYGDIFDVITNDASAEVLNSYPVLFFCGDVPVNKELAGKLVHYVKAGGTLVINSKQIQDCRKLFPGGFFGADVTPVRRLAQYSYSTFSGKMLEEDNKFYYNKAVVRKGAQTAVFTADRNKDPLVVVSSYGKGKVILTLPDFLKEQYSRSKMLHIFHDLISALRDRTLPLKVHGDIQYLVHRNKKGYVVSLFNNLGSGWGQTWDNPRAKPDPKWDRTVTIRPKFKYKSVREWFTGAKTLKIKVPAGDVRIVEITL